MIPQDVGRSILPVLKYRRDGNLTLSALVALTFPFVVPDKAFFVATVLACILAIVLIAPGAVPDLFPLAFALVLTNQPLIATAFPAVVPLVVPTHFNQVIVCQRRQLESGEQQRCKCERKA